MPAGVPSESWAAPSAPLTFAQPEDAWSHLHTTFTREAQEAGVAGRRRCEVLFVGDSITEAMRGTQFGERYEELGARARAFVEAFPRGDALAFGIAGDRTQHLLFRLKGGELSFRHAPKAVVLMIGTNNLGRDGDDAHDTFLGIKACAATVAAMLPGSKIVLPGILPRGPPLGQKEQVPPAPGETVTYAPSGSGILQQALANPGHGAGRAVGQGSRRRAGKYAQPGQHTAAIDAVNHELAALAAASGGRMVYVDAKPAFLDAQGDIVPEFMRDALHPSGGGYRSYFKRLLPVLDEIREAGRRAHREDLAARTKLSGAHQGHGSLASLDPEFRPAVEQLVTFTPHGVCLISPRQHEVVYGEWIGRTRQGAGGRVRTGRPLTHSPPRSPSERRVLPGDGPGPGRHHRRELAGAAGAARARGVREGRRALTHGHRPRPGHPRGAQVRGPRVRRPGPGAGGGPADGRVDDPVAEQVRPGAALARNTAARAAAGGPARRLALPALNRSLRGGRVRCSGVL